MAFLILEVLATSPCITSEGNTNADSELKHAMVTDEDFNCQQNQAINSHINSLFKSLIFNMQSKDHSQHFSSFCLLMPIISTDFSHYPVLSLPSGKGE